MLLRSIRFASVALVLATAACSGAQTTSEPTATAAQGTSVAPLNVTVHGRAKAIAEALGQVPLRADQRATIEQMAKDAETRHQPDRAAREALLTAIADQVQAGTIDRTALQPKIDALTAAHEAARPADRAAFEKLHDLLTSDQRVAFVTAMQNQFGSHEGRGREGMRGRMQKWATDIGLSQDQQDQIRQKLQAQWHAHMAGAVVGTDEQKTEALHDGQMAFHAHQAHEHMTKMLEAFKGDTFSMDAVAPIAQDRPMAKEFAGHMLNMVEAALPVLTADQRALVATKLRARAANLEEEEK
jgi:hypothetical protein